MAGVVQPLAWAPWKAWPLGMGRSRRGHTPPQPKDTGKLGNGHGGHVLHVWPDRWLIGGSKHFGLQKVLDGGLVSAPSGTQLAAVVRLLFK